MTHSPSRAEASPTPPAAPARAVIPGAALAALCLGLLALLLVQPPRTIPDLAVIAGVFVGLCALVGPLPGRVRAAGAGALLLGGLAVALLAQARQPAVEPVTHGGFEIRVDPRSPGMVRLQSLSVDGQAADLRGLVVRGAVEPFTATGIASGDRDLLIRSERPYRHAHFDFIADDSSAGLVIVDRVGARFLAAKGRRWSDQRYHVSPWEMGPFLGRVLLAAAAALGLATVAARRAGWDGLRLAVAAALAGVALASFPGIFSPDSADQFHQCTTGAYFRNHPLASTLLGCAPRYVLDTPLTATLLQLAAYAALVFALMRGLERTLPAEAGARRLAVRLAVAALAFNPVVLSMIAYFGKDVPFGLCLVLALAVIGGVIRFRSARLARLVLYAALCGVALLRPNGALLIAVILVLAALLRFEGRGAAAAACAGALVTFVAFEAALRWAGVGGPAAGFFVGHLVALPIHTIGYALKAGTLTDPAHLAVAASFADLEKLRAGFDAHNFSAIQFSALNHDGVARNAGAILATWLDLVRTQPGLALRAMLAMGWTVLVPVWAPGTQLYVFPASADAPNLWAMLGPSVAPPFAARAWAPALWDMMTAVNIRATTPYLYALLSPSTFLWASVLLLAAWAAIDRRRVRAGRAPSLPRPLLAAGLAGVLFMLGTGLLIPSPEVRYTWWMYPVMAMLAGAALAARLAGPERRGG